MYDILSIIPESIAFLGPARRWLGIFFVFMRRVISFIDGFNLYHSLDENPKLHKNKWLSLRALTEQFLTTNEKLIDVYYFTAYSPWISDSYARHKIYVKAVKSENVNVVFGKFSKKWIYCYKCKQTIIKPEEKRTDVNIALHLLQLAHENAYDTALIVSGDGDFFPAVELVKTQYKKRVVVIFPINRHRGDLDALADYNDDIKEHHLNKSRFPDNITLASGKEITCPDSWK